MTNEQPTAYIEEDCAFTHKGKKFTSGGAFISPTHARGYVAFLKGSTRNLRITDWHGSTIGFGFASSSWAIHSYISDRMYQIYANIDGTEYTGRSCGEGMVWNGKRVA